MARFLDGVDVLKKPCIAASAQKAVACLIHATHEMIVPLTQFAVCSKHTTP